MYLIAWISSEAWGDESAQKNIFRDAINNGTVRIPVRSYTPSRFLYVHCIEYTIHIIVFTIHILPCDSCVIIYRAELHLPDVQVMSDKQLDLMIRKVRLYMSYIQHAYCLHALPATRVYRIDHRFVQCFIYRRSSPTSRSFAPRRDVAHRCRRTSTSE